MVTSGVASTIFEFLADPILTSLELPPMTKGQRESIKKLVQQHPELSCESYGFGEERQLYLFKKGGSGMQQEVNSQVVDKGTGLTPSDVSNKEESCRNFASLAEVRNTFIHMDTAPVDERAIQSMPRNMFRRCLLTESTQRAAVHKTRPAALELEQEPMPDDAEAQEAGQPASLCPGALVVVEGLVKLPAFNGRSAVVQGWDEAAGRYDIMFAAAGAPDGCQRAKIKEENLRLVLSCL